VKQPLWKRLLSYVYEFHIESAPSEHNPHLYVSLNRGRYQLCTANAVYSFEDLYDNFGKAFAQLNLDLLPGSKVLILGFGMGSVPLILETKHHKDYEYTAVEIDENVIYLADKYIVNSLASSFTYYCQDAQMYTWTSQEQFDLIISDVFLDDTIPHEFESIDYLETLSNLLNDNGLLLYNRLYLSVPDQEKTKQYYNKVFKKAFPKAMNIDTNGNWILVNDERFLK